MILAFIYWFSIFALLAFGVFISFLINQNYGFNPFAVTGVTVGLLMLLAFLADKLRIRLHDRRILAKAESCCTGRHYRDPAWQRAFAAYESRHPLRQLSRGGVVSRVTRFFRLSPLNFKAAIALLVFLYGGLRLIVGVEGVGLDPAKWDSFLLWNLGLPVLFFVLFFILSGFFTGVPCKVWLKQISRSRGNRESGERSRSRPDPEKVLDSARYLSSGESLFIFGNNHLLMANLDGVMLLPWSRIAEVTRAVLVFPQYLRTRRIGNYYYCGLKLYQGVIIRFRDTDDDVSDIPQGWQGGYADSGFRKEGACAYSLPEITKDYEPDEDPDSFREMLYRDAMPGADRKNWLHPATNAEFFPMNEFSMQIFITEICQRFRLPQEEPCDAFKKYDREAREHDYSDYNLSDFC